MSWAQIIFLFIVIPAYLSIATLFGGMILTRHTTWLDSGKFKHWTTIEIAERKWKGFFGRTYTVVEVPTVFDPRTIEHVVAEQYAAASNFRGFIGPIAFRGNENIHCFAFTDPRGAMLFKLAHG